ncbi:MAG TPA: enolase C-terminal domain-like protein, partial [Blastococcus sp.]
MSQTVADVLLSRRRDWGVRQVFGFPGDGIEEPVSSDDLDELGQLRLRHCAASLDAPVAAALPELRHVKWFADHARLEPLLVDGAPPVEDGAPLVPDAPGHGMTLRPRAQEWRVGREDGRGRK